MLWLIYAVSRVFLFAPVLIESTPKPLPEVSTLSLYVLWIQKQIDDANQLVVSA